MSLADGTGFSNMRVLQESVNPEPRNFLCVDGERHHDVSYLRSRSLNLDECPCLKDVSVEIILSLGGSCELDLSRCDLITDDRLTCLSSCWCIE